MDVNECIGCGRESLRFRVVLDLETERKLGTICKTCLTERFGETICHPEWRNPDGCSVCDRDAFYGLPDVRLRRETRGDRSATSRFEYSIDDETVQLCDEHLTCLSREASTTQRVAADGGY